MGMMGKLKETQKKVEATKERLKTITLEESDAEGKLKITITADRQIKDIEIDRSLLEDGEQLEDLLVITLNKAVEKASLVHDAELAAVAKEGMPNIPGLDSLLK